MNSQKKHDSLQKAESLSPIKENAPSILTTFSALFLVAGTCIGGGMLALPVATGISGFFPSLFVMGLSYFAMTATALLLLELTLDVKEDIHVIGMASRFLGPFGKGAAWVLYLFICYASLVAYAAGGGLQMTEALCLFFGTCIDKVFGIGAFILGFGLVIWLGTKIVGRVNAIFFLGMLFAYFGLVTFGFNHIDQELLYGSDWKRAYRALPFLLTSFSFQTMVPSLTPYLRRHRKALKIAIIGGTSLAFLLYALWQCLILGIIPPSGPDSLEVALLAGQPATQFLRPHVDSEALIVFAQSFAFFAIATSFLGIAFGLFDFLSEGLSLPKVGWKSVLLGLIIALPTFLFAAYYENAFLVAMEMSGGFGDTLLNGLIPIIMAYHARYRIGFSKNPCLFGGKPMLFLLTLFFGIALGLQALSFFNPV